MFSSFSLPAISGLGLQWFSVPGVSWLMAEVGGIQFPASPFSGWYSSVEILRDFLEECRYPGLMKVNVKQSLNQCFILHLISDLATF